MTDKQQLRKGKVIFYHVHRLITNLISVLEVFMYPSASIGLMELIESIVWVGVGFGPTLMALKLLSDRAEKTRSLSGLKESKTEMEVTL